MRILHIQKGRRGGRGGKRQGQREREIHAENGVETWSTKTNVPAHP